MWRKSSGDDGEQEWTAVTVMTARIGEDWMVAIVMQITTTQLDWIVNPLALRSPQKENTEKKKKAVAARSFRWSARALYPPLPRPSNPLLLLHSNRFFRTFKHKFSLLLAIG